MALPTDDRDDTERVILDILEGGLLTSVQDTGRPDWTHQGVPQSGAADPWSHAVANLLAGNDPAAAALELTIIGPTFSVRRPTMVGLAGADLGARIRDGRRLAPGRAHRLVPGDVVEIPGDPAGPAAGARAYLAIRGGIDVPIVLGSRSTCLAAGFGGFAGRPLRAGDRLSTLTAASTPTRLVTEHAWSEPDDLAGPFRVGGSSPVVGGAPATLRVIAGPSPGMDALAGQDWRVGAAADRVGVRLDGGPLPAGIAGETTTHAVPWGAIQVPPDGRPIILGVDHQVTGGYPVVGVVISADRPVLGQLRPGAAVRLASVDRTTAIAALREQRAALAAGAAALGDAAAWDALVESAGG